MTIIVTGAESLDWGGYLTYSCGRTRIDEDYSNSLSWYNLELDGEVDIVGIGFVISFLLDKHTAKDRPLNYRLNVGLEKIEYDIESVFNKTLGTDYIFSQFELNFTRITVDNTFCFDILRKEAFQLWLGPQIRLAYMSGDGLLVTGNQSINYGIETGCIGCAPVFGVNFYIEEVVSLDLDLGYRFCNYSGEVVKSGNLFSGSGDFSSIEEGLFINLSLIF